MSRNENPTLCNEIEELKNKLQKVTDDLSKINMADMPNGNGHHAGKAHSIEFMSSQYGDFIRFKVEAERQIQELVSRVKEISILCNHIRKSIEVSEAYSYQFNIKKRGVR